MHCHGASARNSTHNSRFHQVPPELKPGADSCQNIQQKLQTGGVDRIFGNKWWLKVSMIFSCLDGLDPGQVD